MDFNNSRAVKAYLKKQCPKWDEDRIYILPKNYTFGFIIIIDGKLHEEHFYGVDDIKPLIPKLNDYFEGREWDPNTYWEYYPDNTPKHRLEPVPEGIFQYPSEDVQQEALDMVRERAPSCGVREVARPKDGNFIPWNP